MRVGLVIPSLMTGGAEQHVVKLCQTASPSEVNLSVFLLLRDATPTLRPGLPAHVAVFTNPFGRRDPRTVKWLADRLRADRIDLAHSFLWYADAVTSMSRALFSSVALVCSERGDRSEVYYPPIRRVFDRMFTFRLAERVCANSEYGGRILTKAGCDPSKVRVIRNAVNVDVIDAVEPVDIRALLQWPPETVIVGAVGRLIWYKGVDTVLKSIAQFVPRQEVGCVIVGDGPERPALERRARDLGIAHRVKFLGLQTPVTAFVKGFDIAVLATRTDSEHCSNTILEYMACGKPVIATRIAGNPELVVNGQTGLLVEPENDAELADAIGQLLRDRQRMRQMGIQGRERASTEFRMSVTTHRFIELWREVHQKNDLR